MHDLIEKIAKRVNGEVRKDYSGRGMFGKTCWGIVCDDPNEVVRLAVNKGLRNNKLDNMGKSYIVYWPSVT